MPKSRPLYKLDKQSGALFSVLPPVQPTAETSQSVIDDLNADSRVLYAYPVFVNPATGLRVFLNDEIVVGFNQSPADAIVFLLRPKRGGHPIGHAGDED